MTQEQQVELKNIIIYVKIYERLKEFSVYGNSWIQVLNKLMDVADGKRVKIPKKEDV